VKNSIKYILQKALGFKRYLLLFSRYKIKTLHRDKKERDFFVFINLLNNPKLILDIGANIGIMTIHLGQKFKNASIHAIEPMPDNLYALKKNIRYFNLSNVIVHSIAVGHENKMVKMILPEQGRTKMQGLSHVKHSSITEWNEGNEFEVECKRLDTIFPTEKIDAIKIDVENFEYFVLKGGLELITRSKPIIYAELWNNENRTNCFRLLTKLGYTINVLDNNIMVPYDAPNHNQQNFIFIMGE
jgi:FkbM family methyltransferase